MSTNIDFDSFTGDLSLDDILAIEKAGSEKGIYQRDLLDFVHSGKLGVRYNYSGKNAQSVKMGFTSAIDALQKKDDVSAEDKASVKEVEVRVRKGEKDASGNQDEYVFLINQAAVRAQRGEQTTAAAPAAE
ncbi:MAG TPA: hypothetical protein VGE97_07550 [Nitrososphaera sp.]|jgi:hypothetical protein